MYPSNITFLYYNDISQGEQFIKEVLCLPLIMDQGFAKVYQMSETSYLGIVQKKEAYPHQGDTLVSLNTSNVEQEFSRVRKLNVYECTDIIDFPNIPLRSFFFQDSEGHRFEIQEFQLDRDRDMFL